VVRLVRLVRVVVPPNSQVKLCNAGLSFAYLVVLVLVETFVKILDPWPCMVASRG
jgi:hypothetical protein